jgi:hypothetical protein
MSACVVWSIRLAYEMPCTGYVLAVACVLIGILLVTGCAWGASACFRCAARERDWERLRERRHKSDEMRVERRSL